MFLFYFFVWFGIGGGIGAAIGSSKGRGGTGFVLGVLLGFIGWIIVAVMEPTVENRLRSSSELLQAMQASQPNQSFRDTPTDRACPWCAELIKPAARVCRFCGRDVPPFESMISPSSLTQNEYESIQVIKPQVLNGLSADNLKKLFTCFVTVQSILRFLISPIILTLHFHSNAAFAYAYLGPFYSDHLEIDLRENFDIFMINFAGMLLAYIALALSVFLLVNWKKPLR